MLTDESGLLTHQRSVVSRLQDQPSKLIMWEMGCIAQGAMISVNRCGRSYRVPIETLVERLNGHHPSNWKVDSPTYVRSYDAQGQLRLKEVTAGIYSGYQPTVVVELYDGYSVRCTPDHRILTAHGWVRADELVRGTVVCTNGTVGCLQCGSTNRVSQAKHAGYCLVCIRNFQHKNSWIGSRKTGTDGYVYITSGLRSHPYITKYSNGIAEHRLVAEAGLNGLTLDTWLSILYSGEDLETYEFLGKDVQVHHVNHDKTDNSPENLEIVSVSDHLAGRHRVMDRLPNFAPVWREVHTVRESTPTHVYDLTVPETENFVADGVVVHNCGKTAAAVAIDRDIRQNLDEGTRGATLIVCPKSVLGVWQHWLSWAGIPDDSVFVIDPTDREPFQQALWEHVASKGASRETWFVCHWDAIPKLNFTRAGTKTRPMKFTHIIGDEIHRISGRKTRRTTAFKQIKAQYKTGLSGTPSDDKIQDLWSVLHWLQPGVWTSYIRFCRSYLQWVVPEPEKGYWIVTGTKNLADLRARIADFSDRVRLDEVTDLPAKTYTTLTVDLGPAQRRPYNQMRDDLLADVGEGGRNTLLSPQQVNAQQRLQQLALSALDVDEDTDRVFAVEPSAKLDALVELLLDHPDEQFVVFCQYVDVLHLVAQRLRRARIPAASVPFTGALLRPNRDRQVSDFQGGETRVIYGTIGAMGTGITLTAARAVVFLDRSDKPNENEQAENRAHRIGQQGTVQVIDLVARDTVDEQRYEQIAEKGDRLEELYGD